MEPCRAWVGHLVKVAMSSNHCIAAYIFANHRATETPQVHHAGSIRMALFTHHIPGGSFTCAMPVDRVYLLAFEYPPKNCLSTGFMGAFSFCLTMISDRYPTGVVITTSRIPNFYCSGHIQDEPMVWALFRQILTYPMPTLALINGDAISHGLLFALCHDVRIQNNVPSASLRICDGSSEPGGPTPRVASLIKARLPGPFNLDAYQLKLCKVNPRDAIRAGFVHGIGHIKEALEIISWLKLLDVDSDPPYWWRRGTGWQLMSATDRM